MARRNRKVSRDPTTDYAHRVIDGEIVAGLPSDVEGEIFRGSLLLMS